MVTTVLGTAGIASLATACEGDGFMGTSDHMDHIRSALHVSRETSFFDTITDMKDYAPTDTGVVGVLGGYKTKDDGGGGLFYWDSRTPVPADNGGTIIHVNDTSVTGCWKRIYNGGAVNVRWFGATEDEDDATVAVRSAIEAVGHRGVVYFPKGVYNISSIVITDNSNTTYGLTLQGEGSHTVPGSAVSRLHHTSEAPMFTCSGTGYISNFAMRDLGITQQPSQPDHRCGHILEFSTGGISGISWENVYCQLSSPIASAWHFRGQVSCCRMTSCIGYMSQDPEYRPMAPFVDLQGYENGNIYGCQFDHLVLNSLEGAEAPIFKLTNNFPTAPSGGPQFTDIILEVVGGGGIHLYGFANPVLENVISADNTGSPTADLIVFGDDDEGCGTKGGVILSSILEYPSPPGSDIRAIKVEENSWPPTVIGGHTTSFESPRAGVFITPNQLLPAYEEISNAAGAHLNPILLSSTAPMTHSRGIQNGPRYRWAHHHPITMDGTTADTTILNLGGNHFDGYVEVTITGGWSGGESMGRLTRRFSGCLHNGDIAQSESVVTHADRQILSLFAIGDMAVINNNIVIPILWRSGSNPISVSVEGQMRYEYNARYLLQNIALEEPAMWSEKVQEWGVSVDPPNNEMQYPEFKESRKWHNVSSPAAEIVDGVIQYAADETPGNACPHFRTEAGQLIKLFQSPHIANADASLEDLRTKFNALLSVMKNLGFIEE